MSGAIQIVTESAPVPGAGCRASRQTFAARTNKKCASFHAVEPADGVSARTREGARAPLAVSALDHGLRRGAGFQTCLVAGFQIGAAWGVVRPAGLETRDTADLEVCATMKDGRTG